VKVVVRKAWWLSYNGDAVIINVCLVVELGLNLGVLGLGPGRVVLAMEWKLDNMLENILDTLGVKGGLVDALGNHCGYVVKGSRMEVAPLLLCDLVCEESA
jgi:hypothetical protein